MKTPTRLIKGKRLYLNKYRTRKDFRNQIFNPFLMRSSKQRTELRKYENRRYRRDKFNLAPHKKV